MAAPTGVSDIATNDATERLRVLQPVWEERAQADPLGAVLSGSELAGRQWDLDRFAYRPAT